MNDVQILLGSRDCWRLTLIRAARFPHLTREECALCFGAINDHRGEPGPDTRGEFYGGEYYQ